MLVRLFVDDGHLPPGKRLAARVAIARMAAGLTQEELGERVGVTQQAVSAWEKGNGCDGLTLSAIASHTRQEMEFFRVF